MFLLGTATTFAGAFLAACGEAAPEEVAKTDVPVAVSYTHLTLPTNRDV